MAIFLFCSGSAALTALYAVIPAQNSGAAYSGFIVSGTFVIKSSDAVINSEYPPFSDSPVTSIFSHRYSFSSIQY